MRSLVLFSAILALPALPAAGAAAERPANIVLIVADDLGYGDLACYGAKDVESPHLDRLAAQGIRFAQFRVNPLCAPTRASLLSGLYSLETGMWRGPSHRDGGPDTRDRELKQDIQLLPQYLKRAGYATGMFGKWHLGYEEPNVPNARGFVWTV
jgi:arylsulfatase A-like enzyme